MLLRVERGSAVPVSRQIAEQIASHCAAGKLKAGDRLPSVRELARELAVNQNTVLRVYERLTGEGLLERRQGQGTFVAVGVGRRATAAHRRRLVEELRQVGRQAIGLGLSHDEVHELLSQALDRIEGERADADSAQEATP